MLLVYDGVGVRQELVNKLIGDPAFSFSLYTKIYDEKT